MNRPPRSAIPKKCDRKSFTTNAFAVVCQDVKQPKISIFVTKQEKNRKRRRSLLITEPRAAEGLDNVLVICPERGGEARAKVRRVFWGDSPQPTLAFLYHKSHRLSSSAAHHRQP
jgi:hypothetical protein